MLLLYNYTEGEVELPDILWQTPESKRCSILDAGRAEGYFIDSVQDTKVFVYVGLPAGASADNKVPGIVLVHGGGGTAFYEWVDFWVARGYAAIAMDTDGNMPSLNSSMSNDVHQASTESHGPANAGFTDGNKEINQQWAYHALSAVIVSNSFLRSFTGVDTNRIGITGISYGGFLTSLAAGYDDRFVFACPVYGTISQDGTAGIFGNIFKSNRRSAELWDDIEVLNNTRTPMLFINGSNDQFFTVDATTRCSNATTYGNMYIKHRFLHGHVDGGTQVNELYAFADNICLKKTGLIRITLQPTKDDYAVKVQVPSGTKLQNAVTYYTKDEILNDKTDWKTEYADIEGNTITFWPPSGSTYCYVNVVDDRGFCVSTEVIKLN